MAALPDNTTGRVWVDYTAGGASHSLMVRYGPGSNLGYCLDALDAILPTWTGALPTSWAVTGVRHSEAGQTFSLPVNISGYELNGLAGELANGLGPEVAREVVMVGRSLTTGRRVRFSVYGFIFSTPANFRLGPGELPVNSVQSVAAYNAASLSGDAFVTIDGSRAQWAAYANVNYNSYWETELRG